MSQPHAIDREEPVFDFDPFEEGSSIGAGMLNTALLERRLAPAAMSHLNQLQLDPSSFSAAPTYAECVQYHSDSRLCESDTAELANQTEVLVGKGKDVSRPVDIQPRDTVHSQFDIFSFSSLESARNTDAGVSSMPSSSASTPQTLPSFSFSPGVTPNSMYPRDSVSTSYRIELTTPGSSYASRTSQDGGDTSTKDKGKGKAPCLPPLSFSPTEFARGETNWPIAGTPSPDMHESDHRFRSSSDVDAATMETAAPLQNQPLLTRMPSRRRSFSSLSAHSAKSLAARSMSRIKLKLGKVKSRGNLARTLLLRNRDDLDICPPFDGSQLSANAYPSPGDGHFLSSNAANAHRTSISMLNIDVGTVFDEHFDLPSPIVDMSLTHSQRFLLKHQGQSYSSPLLQTVGTLNVAQSLPVGLVPIQDIAPNLFDGMLPKELKLAVLRALIELHEADHTRVVQSVTWTAMKASSSRSRWVGKDRGIAELVKLSRVSKSWQSLVFDGQLWANLHLRSFPQIPAPLLLRLFASSGGFVRSIDITGHSCLPTTLFSHITQSNCAQSTSAHTCSFITQLTDINIIGCSSLTTHSLHYLIMHSPALLKLRLKGSTAATNLTCELLAAHCPRLTHLDLSWCHNVDADGLKSLLRPSKSTEHAHHLKELRVSGLKRINDEVMAMLGKHLPLLEVLDLAGVRELHNSAIDAFVSCPEDEENAEAVQLTSREAGRDPGDPRKYRRRITRLRHLSLSSCPLLSDIACSNLAHAVPRLECLELAGIGSDLKDDGLVRLLNTTPLIRRLDLEEACDITDNVLEALTPLLPGDSADRPSRSPAPAHTGALLEHLILSYATNLTNDAFLALIRACTRLQTLELDNTRVSGTAIKEFVRLSRRRQAVESEIVAIDCRGVGESAVKELTGSMRTRKGWRAWEARKLCYLDSRDEEGLGVGHDECDEKKVVVKTFYSWQTVDAVEAAREKRRRANKKANHSRNGSGREGDYFSISKGSSFRWWTPGASSRRTSAMNSPAIGGANVDREGCAIM